MELFLSIKAARRAVPKEEMRTSVASAPSPAPLTTVGSGGAACRDNGMLRVHGTDATNKHWQLVGK